MLPSELIWQKTWTVSDAKTAELLSRGAQTIQLLAPFLGKENTTKNAALEAKIKLNVMAYWVQKFVEAGVLLQTRTEKRAGRPVHHYRAIADQIFVPLDLVSSLADAELLEKIQQHEYTIFTQYVTKQGRKYASRWQLQYYTDHQGQHWTFLPMESDQPRQGIRPLHDWLHLNLTPEVFVQLQQDLWQLMDKYMALNSRDTGQKRCTVHLGFVEHEQKR